MMRANEFGELRAFAAVAQERSFRKAATRLGVTPSALSHVIRALEERLGAKLLHRTTRSVALTEAGSALLGRFVPAITDIEHAVSEVGAFSDRPRGRLCINLPRLAAEVVILPKIGQFAQLYPEIALDLVIDDSMADIVAEGSDAGIRSGAHVQGDMIAVRLSADLRGAVIASPAYVAAHGTPAVPSDLREHRCINYRYANNGAVYRWQFKRREEAVEVRVDAMTTINDTNVILRCALAGLGFAYIVEDIVAPFIEDGRLVRVLEEWCPPISGFHLYYSGARHTSAPLRAMIDFFRFSSDPPECSQR